MKTKTQILTLIALTGTLAASQAQTAQTAAQPAPPLSPTEQTIKDIKNPTDWLTWGGDLRIRNEYFNNAQTLTSDRNFNPRYYDLHSQDYFRFRGRLWTSITPIEELSLNARLAAEPRQWMEPSSSANVRGPGVPPGRSGFEGRYGIVDNLNVQWRKPFDLPATLTVGRQDIFPGTPSGLGDGWLIADATPADGSWTFFFDAARLTYDLKEQHTTIDAIGIVQYAQPDAWLPTIGPSTMAGSPARYTLTDQNEKGAILWIANKSVPSANVDGYFIYKHDTHLYNLPKNATATDGAGTYAFGDNADIYTLGARISGPFADNWKYSVEGAYQFGEKQDPFLAGKGGRNVMRDINAYGVNTKLTYLFKDQWNSQVSFSYECLSGDDPSTGRDEMFDVLWGRWPRWSELYAPYSYIPETRTGQMGNVHRFGPGLTLTPVKNLDCILYYFAMFADQEVPTRANVPTAFTGTGTFRGHYLQAILKYKFSRHVSGHLWSEFVLPGDFYRDESLMTFLRAEVFLTF